MNPAADHTAGNRSAFTKSIANPSGFVKQDYIDYMILVIILRKTENQGIMKHKETVQEEMMSEQIAFSKNEVIFKEGEWEFCMYAILSGEVAIVANYGNENELLLNTLKPEDFFGELGLTGVFPRTASAVAKEDTVVEKIDMDDYRLMVKERPDQMLKIIDTEVRILRRLSGEYTEACQTIADYLKTEKEERMKNSGLFAGISGLIDRNTKMKACQKQE